MCCWLLLQGWREVEVVTADTLGMFSIDVGKSLTIFDVARLESLQQQRAQAQGVQLELGRVEEVDAAGIQWLLAVMQRSTLASGGCVINAVSPALADALALMGVEALTTEDSEAAHD